MRNAEQEPEATECDACARIPLSHLGLDLDEPMIGWPEFFRERGVEVVEDDLSRPSVPRRILGELLAEREEQEARVAVQRAAEAAARPAPVPVGVPALDDASPFESMVAAGGVTTPQQDFGRRPRPNFLDEELAAGRRQAADEEAEREAVERAKQLLDGRGK
jgi:hypothetical protein